MNQERITDYTKDFLSNYLDYKSYWNYEDGCVLLGAIALYEAGHDPFYRNFVLNYLNRRVEPNGSIPSYEFTQYNIDSINCGKALFFADKEDRDPRWLKAADLIMRRLSEHPRCDNGSFWHKEIYPYQVWLDGLYMALPFYMRWDMLRGGMQNINDIMHQFNNARALLFDENKKLSFHGWDEKRVQPWVNPENGCSRNFWLRSMGWYLMAMVDSLEALDEQLYEHRQRIIDLLKEAVQGLLAYRAEDGLFYQVIDHKEAKGNYTETSGSAMVAYALMKAARLGFLHREKYKETGLSIFNALVSNKLITFQGQSTLHDICLVAGLGGESMRDGSVAYYLSEPRVADDAKGAGPFMMAYAEAFRLAADA